ncbi:mevalonate kinase [Senegalia sp. (in: firmicutes)]|uniref:mevalonate kinase n=2 Tax=Senegalia sp. (in: firmicutes) TaxID=1924098 RepID=UPI003F986863
MNNSSKIAISDAHSKIILAGEHAVVYGKPAIAIPFPLKVASIVEKSIGPIIFESAIYTGFLYNMPIKLKGISNCIKETLKYLNKPEKNLKIKIISSIPIGRGLGSSAAISISIVRSLFSFFERQITQNELFYLVQIAENYAHGNSSGLDIMATISENPIWFEKERGILSIKSKCPLYIVVADTGSTSDTRVAVENVRKRYNLKPKKVQKSLDTIEEITNEIKKAVLNGNINLLGKLLTNNHNELINIGVSDERLNNLVKLALDSNALGAKLIGGGLGGCMIALARDRGQAKEISNKLVKSDAEKSWYFSTNEDVVMEV